LLTCLNEMWTTVVWLRVVYPLLFNRNQCCFLLNKLKEEMSFISLAQVSVRELLCNVNPTKVFTYEMSSTPTGLL